MHFGAHRGKKRVKAYLGGRPPTACCDWFQQHVSEQLAENREWLGVETVTP